MDNNKEHKFNFSEEENNQDKITEQSKDNVKKDAQGLFTSLKIFLTNLLDFRQDTDRESTINAIKADIPFKGATAWILIFAVFVASIGLNANSTAVVIGAMLISPLMGPILGVGLSVAINDIDTLRKSLVNLAVMVSLSLLTAFMFFYIFPISEVTSELFARTKPDIRDVMIAFFGGSALMVARTKKGTIASVIFGVAIATALMPPLCTAGYGLSQGDLAYFAGAMYLFTINTIFIALSTFLVIKLLRFPMFKYVNSAKRKRIARFASLLAVLVMIPAIWTFVNVLKESNFNRDAKDYINNELRALPHADYIMKNVSVKYSQKGQDTIAINTFGLDEIPVTTITLLKSRLKDYNTLNNTALLVNQNRSEQLDNLKYMEELRSRDSLDLLSQSEKISFLEKKVIQLSKYERNQIKFDEVSKKAKILFENLEQFSYSIEIMTNFSKIDTLPVIGLKWKKDAENEASILKDQEKIKEWLKSELKLDSLIIKSEN